VVLVHFRQNASAETHKAPPLASIRTLGGRPTTSTEEISSQRAQGISLGEIQSKGGVSEGGVPRLNVTAMSCARL
jgi:hypothetical protein